MTEDPPRRGGCRKGMVGCRRGCLHRQMVEEYRLARHAAEMTRESETGGYAAETADYGPIVTFKSWLIARRGSHDEQP